uniref:Synaptobrevin-like protein 5 n=1 Tax=Crassostrea virginica TaxID=6565 RepID=A0A8B8BLA7_CRAVI|nr:synaptobrevin-like protein 5 [Crassostrea virginica]
MDDNYIENIERAIDDLLEDLGKKTDSRASGTTENIQRQLDAIIRIHSKNIIKLRDRDGKLEDLEARAEKLEKKSQSFEVISKKVEKKYEEEYYWKKVIAIVGILALVSFKLLYKMIKLLSLLKQRRG